MITAKEVAQINLHALAATVYPGRGIVVGFDDTQKYLIQACWLMGRDDNNSRNRVYSQDGGRVVTEVADPSKLENPTNLIYTAMDELWSKSIPGIYVVSNGDQTDTVMKNIFEMDRMSLREVLRERTYEQDLACTPRITAICRRYPLAGVPVAEMCIVKKDPVSEAPIRYLFEHFDLTEGLGYYLPTYQEDGAPPPVFWGEPRLIRLKGDIHEVTRTLWIALNATNRVSLAVKFIPSFAIAPSIVVSVNKNQKVPA